VAAEAAASISAGCMTFACLVAADSLCHHSNGLCEGPYCPAQSLFWRRFMKVGLIAAAVAIGIAATSAPSAGRSYGHRHHFCGYTLHYDYTHSNMLSPASYAYPAANWGPFFQCRFSVGPVIYLYPAGPS
jgi:hypothetical protein